MLARCFISLTKNNLTPVLCIVNGRVLLVDHFRWVLMCLFFRVIDGNFVFKVHLPRPPPSPNPTLLSPGPPPKNFGQNRFYLFVYCKPLVWLLLPVFDAHTARSPLVLVTSLYFLYSPILLGFPADAPTPLHTHALQQKSPPWVCLSSPCFPLKKCAREAESTLSWHCPSEELAVLVPQS